MGWRIFKDWSKEVAVITKRLDTMHSDIVRLSTVGECRSRTPDDAQSGLPKGLDDYQKHVKLLRVAADIATAELRCHRDTWAYVAEKAAPQPQHFRTPGSIADEEGRVRTTLSGRSLVAVLTALWTIAHKKHTTDAELVDWALAVTLYKQVANAIEQLRHGEQDDCTKVVIIIDRRRRRPLRAGACDDSDNDEGS
ncbi:hypothetical protein [Streptomyces marispadix]|uniref:Uncharacterized protein n=1 Tax=Streptomyces marispadix TaxID=2922868 RepID=A0ABS9T4U2_9ACTN|nr:hypothetical protein [Streptomyces marispadix]MCH6163546.1 hypothetical protein [Streptomyces marispadix]